MVLKVQSGLPSLALNALTLPRLAISPPEKPVMIMPS